MSGQIDRRRLLAGGVAVGILAAERPVLAAPLGCGALPCAFGPTRTLAQARGALDEILRLNFLPFWRRVVDETRGEGYDLNHDAKGKWLGPAQFALVAQARTCWFFAHLVRRGLADGTDLARAQRGFAVLTSRFVDQVHGGFFWSLGANTYKPERINKQLYGQSFALFALSEYALASGSPAAAMAADTAFAVIDARMRDAAGANYFEYRLRDWSAPGAGSIDYLDQPAGTRSHNTRIHLLEALTTYHLLRPTALARARLADVVALTEAALERSPVPHFRELDGQPATRQSYGHDVETIHLLLRARARLGRCASPPAFYVGVVDAALARGEDPKLGGLYYSGVAGAPADQKERQDWVQAEALITLLELYRLRRSNARLAAFLRELDWVGRYQVDWRYGTWYGQIDPQLRPKGAKAGGDYRAPYHVGRALLDCLRLADEILDGGTAGGCTVL